MPRRARCCCSWCGNRTIGCTFLSCLLYLVVYEMDQTIIASNAKSLSDHFSLVISQIGVLMLVRASVQVLVQPVWGAASDQHSRRWLLFAAGLLWGGATVIAGAVDSTWALLVARIIAGLGLAAVLPIVHHLVSDMYVPSMRGRIFGVLGAGQMLGGLGSVLFATNVSSVDKVLGMDGWRFSFYMTGCFGVLVAMLTALLLSGDFRIRGLGDRAIDQAHLVELSLARADGTSTEVAGSIEGYQANPMSLSGSCRNIRVLFSQRTYLLLFFRSALDGIPMNANALLVLWFEYMGYSEARASSLVAILLLSNCVSSVTFGIIGDEAHRRFPGRGRIFTAMITLLFQIVATVSLFALVKLPSSAEGPSTPEQAFSAFAVVLVFLGLFGDADQQCCDLPILADVVHPSMRGLGYGLCDMAQCFFAFLATVLVGLLAEGTFGFVHDLDHPISQWDISTRVSNTHALGYALLTVNLFAQAGSMLLYLLISFTYREDLARMRASLGKSAGSEPETESLLIGAQG